MIEVFENKKQPGQDVVFIVTNIRKLTIAN